MSGIGYEIVNVVGMGHTHREIDLTVLYDELEENQYPFNLEYNPETYPGIIIRLDEGEGATIMIYKSGKYIIAGATSKDDLKSSNEYILDVFCEIGLINQKELAIEIQYMTATADLATSIDLPLVAHALGAEKTEFEPEQFPTVIYRPEEINVVFLINNSGIVVVTGAKSENEIEIAIEHLNDELDYLSN